MRAVEHWTGAEVRILRHARRMSIREFARHLGVSDRMVSKWEAGGSGIRPRPANQEALDESLRRCGPSERSRFDGALHGIPEDTHPPRSPIPPSLTFHLPPP